MFRKKKEIIIKNQFDFTDDIDAMSDIVQKNTVESTEYFNKLLMFLTNPYPENRIAACNALGKTSRESAFTNISHWLQSEQNPNVIDAMKKALGNIRKNINAEHQQNKF